MYPAAVLHVLRGVNQRIGVEEERRSREGYVIGRFRKSAAK